MQQKNPAETFFEDMQAKFKEMMVTTPAASPFDLKLVMEAQRKNMQAIAQANQMVMQGWQTMAQRQAEMVSQFVQDNSSLARETMKEGTAQDKFSKQADIAKKACEKSMLNSQELIEIMRKSTFETAEVLSKRMIDSISEIKSSANK